MLTHHNKICTSDNVVVLSCLSIGFRSWRARLLRSRGWDLKSTLNHNQLRPNHKGAGHRCTYMSKKFRDLLSRQLRRLSLPSAPIEAVCLFYYNFFLFYYLFFNFAAYLSFSNISAVKTVAENPYEIDLLTSARQGTVDCGSQYSPTPPMSLSRVTPPWKGERGGGTCKDWARTLHDWDLSPETVPIWTFNSIE